MAKGVFVNRVNDFGKLKTKIFQSNLEELSAGTIIYSRTGVGKSRFVDEFLAKELDQKVKLKVRSRIRPGEKADNFYFASILCDELLSWGKEVELPHKSILTFAPSLGVNLGPIGIGNIITVNYNADAIYPTEILAIRKILKAAFTNPKNSFVIHFENFHAIDSTSYELFTELFSMSSRHYFIFEYTVNSEADLREMFLLRAALSEYINVDLYNLEIMDLCEVKKICENLNINFEVARKIYHDPKTAGDLTSVVMLNNVNNDRLLNSALYKIDDLTDDELFIMLMVDLNGGMIRKSQLTTAIATSSGGMADIAIYKLVPSRMATLIEALVNKDLIEQFGDTLLITYAKVLSDIKERYNKCSVFYAALSTLINHYWQLIDCASEKDNAVIHLIKLYSLKHDPEIISLIPYIKDVILTQKYPEAIIEKTNKILCEIATTQKDLFIKKKITLDIISLLFLKGDARSCRKHLEHIYTEEDPVLVSCMATLIASDVDAPDSEQALLKAIDILKDDASLSIYTHTCLLTYYMRTRCGVETQQYAFSLLRKFKSNTTLEYGFMLKACSEMFNNPEALNILCACNKIFDKNLRQDLSCLCKITIASRFAYTGELAKAQDILNESYSYVLENNLPVRHYYYMNNFAALAILSGNFSVDVEHWLQDALIFVRSDYEKSIILCNLLIFYAHHLDIVMLDDVIYRLSRVNISKYRYEELRHIYHSNMHYALRVRGKTEEADAQMLLLRSMLEEENITQELKSLIHASFERKSLPDGHQWHFYSSLPYRPDFIGYWQFEMPNYESVRVSY